MSLLNSASLVVTPNGYKPGTLYSVIPNTTLGDMTVVRATTATRVNSAGLIESMANNVPRLDYLNASCPSLLVEPQRSNLALRSEEFDNASWTKTGVWVTANDSISPDVNTNADKLFNSVGTSGFASQTISLVSSTIYSGSVFAKNAGRDSLFVLFSGSGGNASCTFDLTTLTTTPSGGVTAKIEDYGGGWYRCSVVFTATSTGASAFRIYPTLTTGDGTSGVYLWGTQLEAGSYPTSYIPTTTATVTRNADVISKTGISSLIGTEFTLFFDGYETTGGNSSRYLVLKGTGGTYANAVFLESNASNQIALTVLDNSSATVFNALSSSLTNGQRVKFAVRCKNNDFAFYLNGAQIATQASGTVPTTSDLYLGYYTDYADNYNKINSAVIFPIGLTNAELISLTTI